MTTNFGEVDVVPLLVPSYGAIVYYGWGRATTNFAGVDVVPLLGAIAGRHCSVLWLGEMVTTNFGGVDVVPLLGAVAGCHWRGG